MLSVKSPISPVRQDLESLPQPVFLMGDYLFQAYGTWEFFTQWSQDLEDTLLSLGWGQSWTSLCTAQFQKAGVYLHLVEDLNTWEHLHWALMQLGIRFPLSPNLLKIATLLDLRQISSEPYSKREAEALSHF